MTTVPVARRRLLGGLLVGTAAAVAPGRAALAAALPPEPMTAYEPVTSELVLNILVTCSDPEPTGGPDTRRPAKDGVRDEIWPIVGGRFWGRGLRGVVVPGGGDFPVERPDGVGFVDALYRLKTDDGVTIVIHNRGLNYPPVGGNADIYRTVPEFFAPAGRYDWLNKAVFVGTLVYPVPPGLAMARGGHENDRLIQVYKIG